MALKIKNTEKETDWELIQQALLYGDEKAYAQLFKKFKNTIYQTVFLMVKDAEQAEDLTMEVFTKAFKNLGQYQPDYTFLTWLNTVAKNHTISFMRKKKPDSISIDISAETRPGRTLLQVEDKAPDPEAGIESVEMHKNIHLLVNALKPGYKKLIELRYFEELPYEDIASQMNLPLGTVKAQIFRAKNLMFQMVKNKRDQL